MSFTSKLDGTADRPRNCTQKLDGKLIVVQL